MSKRKPNKKPSLDEIADYMNKAELGQIVDVDEVEHIIDFIDSKLGFEDEEIY